MKHIKRKKNPSFLRFLNIKNWGISVQIMTIIILLFFSYFFLMQQFSQNIFSDYYFNREVEKYNEIIDNEIDKGNDLFSSSINLNTEYDFLYPLIYDSNFKLDIDYSKYEITLNNGDKYSFSNYIYDFKVGDIISIKLDSNNDINSILINKRTYFYNYSTDVTNELKDVTITNIKKPKNINYKFFLNVDTINNLLSKDMRHFYDNRDLKTNSYIMEDNYIILFKEINGHYLVSVIPVYTSDIVLDTIYRYNVYAFIIIAFFLILLWILLTFFISYPIKDLISIADNISNLDFSTYADKKTNTEMKRLSQTLNRLSSNLSYHIDKLNLQNKEINSYIKKQERDFEIKKTLVASMSHELKTPLFVIQASIQGILDGVIEKDQINTELNQIVKSIETLTEMIQNMLSIYNLEGSSIKLNITKIDIVKINNDIFKSLSQNMKFKNIKFKNNGNKDKIFINADELRFSKVIENLVLNAIKYTPNDNMIISTITEDENMITYNLTNYGVTIDDTHLPFLFDPFYKVDSLGKQAIGGSGLGLYLVKETLDKHKFKFEMTNVENGVSFKIFISKERR